MNSEREVAIDFIKNCKEIYPEMDLMDEATRNTYLKCWEIIRSTSKRACSINLPDDEKVIVAKKPKTKRSGKLKLYEETVLHCLRSGSGEEKQLLEEANNRKNVFARNNYIKAYNRALKRFQRGE